MTALGVGLFFLGYWILYYGIDQIRGGNDGLLDIGIPGRFQGTQQKDQKGACPGAQVVSANLGTKFKQEIGNTSAPNPPNPAAPVQSPTGSYGSPADTQYWGS